MKITTIQHQQYHVFLNIEILNEIFSLRALIDTGANINVLNKKIIPAKYWISAKREVTGLGKQELKYEIPKATIFFHHYCMNVKFTIGNMPIDYILGTPFLEVVEPNGSTRLENGES